MSKKFMWAGFFLGSSIGGFVPAIWGGDMFSIWGIVMSLRIDIRIKEKKWQD
jgi:hypothetical protein